MAVRIIIGIILTAGITALYIVDRKLEYPFCFYGLVAAMAAAGAFELAKLLENQRKPLIVDRWILLACGMTLLALVAFGKASAETSATNEHIVLMTTKWALIMTAFTLVITGMTRVWERETELFGSKLAGTTFAFLYIFVPSAMLIGLRRLGHGEVDSDVGFWLVAWLLIVVRLGADSGAYFVGKFFAGREADGKTPKRPMIPHVSPGKTWEGTTGGLLIGTALGFGMAFLDVPVWTVRLRGAFLDGDAAGNWWLGVFVLTLLSFLIAFVGVHGDLVESALKRSANVKDSSLRVGLPQFGGVLDLIDSILLATPVVFIAVAVA